MRLGRSILLTMDRVLKLFGVLLILSAGVILAACARDWQRRNPDLDAFLAGPGAMESFTRLHSHDTAGRESARSPLLLQAQAFAQYLNPPKPQPTTAAPIPTPSTTPLVPVIRPSAALPQFRVRATCYYPSQPEESRALIEEPGADSRNNRWVREGAHIGHFVIAQIRSGTVVCVCGDQKREMAVERRPSPMQFVKHRLLELAQANPSMEMSRFVADVNAVGSRVP
jgi:hypothetical protein